MELFREEYLTIQDDYLSVDPSRDEPNEDDDLEYDNDDLGENTEVTPLGDAIEDDDINDYKVGPGDDDEFDDDEELDVDLDEAEVEEEEDTVWDLSASNIEPSEDDDFEDDEDLLDDDDDLDADISPDLDDDDLLSDDDDDLDDLDDDTTARTSIDTNADFASRPHGRTTGTMIDHEPGLPGSGNL